MNDHIKTLSLAFLVLTLESEKSRSKRQTEEALRYSKNNYSTNRKRNVIGSKFGTWNKSIQLEAQHKKIKPRSGLISEALRSEKKIRHERKKFTSKLNQTEYFSKTHYREAKSRFSRKSIFSFVNIAVMLLVFPSAINCSDVNVSWKLQSSFVVFGNTARLNCNITDYSNLCNKFYQEWYGGYQYKTLCRDGICRNHEKYSAVKESSCSFTLEIHNFSESDINCDYSCYYGWSFQRQKLALDNLHFAYIPGKQDILYRNGTMSNKTDTTNHIRRVIELSKVYPVPVCNITFENKQISRNVNITTKENGIFYSCLFNISYLPSSCHGQLKMKCDIGKTIMIPYTENITVCSAVKSQRENLYKNLGFAALAIILLVFLGFILWELRNCRKRKRSRSSKRELMSIEGAGEELIKMIDNNRPQNERRYKTSI